MEMEQPLNDLLDLLETIFQLHRALFEILQKERQALIDLDLDGIGTYCKKKENQILRIKILEEQRLQIMGQLAGRLHETRSDLSLTRLAEKVNILYAQRLMDAAAALMSIARDIKSLNEANKSLISFSRDMLSGSMALFENLLSPEPVYQKNAHLGPREPSGRLLTRVV